MEGNAEEGNAEEANRDIFISKVLVDGLYLTIVLSVEMSSCHSNNQ